MNLLNICFEDKIKFIIPYSDRHKFAYLIYLIEERNTNYLFKYLENLHNQELKLESIFFIERFYFNNFDIAQIIDYDHIKQFLKKENDYFYFKITYESVYYLSSLQNNQEICSFLFDYVDIDNDNIFYSTFIYNNFCYINYDVKNIYVLEDYMIKYINNLNNPFLIYYYINIRQDIKEYINFLFSTFNFKENIYLELLKLHIKFPLNLLKNEILLYNHENLWLYEKDDLIHIKNKIIIDIEKVHIQSMIMDF